MLKRLLIAVAISLVIISACSRDLSPSGSSPDTSEDTLTVLAAASLTEAFQELGERFEAQHPGTNVVFNFAGSQQLAQQLAQGAPGDVFASANQIQMQNAITARRVDPDQDTVMVGNRLAIVYPPDNPAGIRRMLDLARPGIKLVLGDEAVPIGGYSLEFLEKASQDAAFGAQFTDAVTSNVVSFEQSVRAVLNKVILGEADAGIVYSSDVNDAGSIGVSVLLIPDQLNVNASYFIAPITDSVKSELAEAFISFVISIEGQDILAKYGFRPVY
jgi:molybdate transport system substrate-binding protein